MLIINGDDIKVGGHNFMPQKEDTLKEIFKEAGAFITENELPRPNRNKIEGTNLINEVINVYKKLGGKLDTIPCRLDKWDMEINNIAVELDEERHFNRYRQITLQAHVYDLLPMFPRTDYQRYCQEYEDKCLRSASFGGYWTNPSCENQFGPASQPGVLTGHGSPRWKQRAFYDFLRDLSPLLINVPLVRISIWDRVTLTNNNTVMVRDVLDRCNYEAAGSLLKLLNDRKPLC